MKGYQAKERTPQAGFGRKRQLGGRITGSHKLEGGGDRVRLSRELELDAIEQALVEPWQRTNAKRKADRKEYRKRPLTARAPRLSGQILLFPDMRPVARLQAFGGGYIPRARRCRDRVSARAARSISGQVGQPGWPIPRPACERPSGSRSDLGADGQPAAGRPARLIIQAETVVATMLVTAPNSATSQLKTIKENQRVVRSGQALLSH